MQRHLLLYFQKIRSNFVVMNKIIFWITILMLSILSGYVHAQSGSGKDLFTGLKIKYKGLDVKEYYLMDAETRTRIQKNTIPLGGYKFAIVVTGVKGYKKSSNGKVSPGVDMYIIDMETNKTILDAADILKGEYSANDAEVLDAYFTTGSPMESGKKYLFKARFYDKNGKGEINAEVILTAE